MGFIVCLPVRVAVPLCGTPTACTSDHSRSARLHLKRSNPATSMQECDDASETKRKLFTCNKIE